jgi:hypothetical protein
MKYKRNTAKCYIRVTAPFTVTMNAQKSLGMKAKKHIFTVTYTSDTIHEKTCVLHKTVSS